eukprot:GHVT01083361.1.p2 GENE.GHVT01083361.1~~GHVT01083361.1.p2  ORF type:complete len:116 (+),score=6.52 GHVT01083361.1:390-737(+)
MLTYEEELKIALLRQQLTCRLVAGLLIQQEEDKKSKVKKRARKRRTMWARNWLLQRPLFGHYEQLVDELRASDVKGFKNFLRVDPELFDELVQRVGPRIKNRTPTSDALWNQDYA